jgi:hypothetical protein
MLAADPRAPIIAACRPWQRGRRLMAVALRPLANHAEPHRSDASAPAV